MFNKFILAYQQGRAGSFLGFEDQCKAVEMLRFSVEVAPTGEEEGGCVMSSQAQLKLGDTYVNTLGCREMLSCISHVIQERDHDRIRKSPVFGSARDEATDIATESALILYVKIVENGRSVTVFLGLEPLDNGSDAASIFEVDEARLAEIFEGDVNEMHKRHMAAGADGCNTMLGHKTGLVTRYKRKNVRLKATHCMAHRLALSVRDAASSIELISVFQEQMKWMYGFFKQSAKRKGELRDVQKELGEKPQGPKKQFDVRWLSLGQSADRAKKIVPALHKYMTSVVESLPKERTTPSASADDVRSKASRLLEMLTNHNFLLTLHAVDEILDKVNRFCEVLQMRQLQGKMVKEALEIVINGLKLSWASPDRMPGGGMTTRAFLQPLHEALQSAKQRAEGKDVTEVTYLVSKQMLCGCMPEGGSENASYTYEVKCKIQEHEKTMLAMRDFALSIIDSLTDRFGGLEELEKFDCLDPSSIPVEAEARHTFGDDNFSRLTQEYGQDKTSESLQFPALFDPTDAMHEWETFKETLAQENLLGQDMEQDEDVLVTVLTSSKFVSFKIVRFLIQIKMVVWLQTAECERGFSKRTEIKTKQRASLGSTLLDILMRIKINGPRIEETFKVTELMGEAMRHFKSVKERCPQRGSKAERIKHSSKESAIGQLRSWNRMLAARENDGLDDEDDEEIHGIKIPDAMARTQEMEEQETLEEEDEATFFAREKLALDAIPDFETADGWKVLDMLPDDIDFPGAPNLCKDTAKYLKQKQVACKNLRVDENGGWERGQVHMQEKSKQNMGLFSVKVPNVRGWVLYDLSRQNYKSRWVLLEKELQE